MPASTSRSGQARATNPAPLRLRPEHRDAWVEVDLAAVVENARTLEGLCSPGCLAAPVIKANAYGHGAVPVGRALADAGFGVLCVATLDEALELRSAGLRGRVVMLYEPPLAALTTAIDAGVEVAIGSPEGMDAILRLPVADRTRVRVQLKIDTGMSRQGLRFDTLGRLGDGLRALAPTVTGIWTHLSDGADRMRADRQLERFDAAVEELRGLGVSAPRHSSGSAAILCGRGTGYELVRRGLALFGIRPAEIGDRGAAMPVALRPAMAVRAQPVRVVTVPSGTEIGYGGTYTTTRTTRLATLPVGYADGLRRTLAASAFALLGSARAPLVGRISMDSCAVDVTDLGNVTRDSVFTLLGEDGGQTITVEQLATEGGTIPQEILLGFDDRLPQIYHGRGGA
jgi:alanine racemase